MADTLTGNSKFEKTDISISESMFNFTLNKRNTNEKKVQLKTVDCDYALIVLFVVGK